MADLKPVSAPRQRQVVLCVAALSRVNSIQLRLATQYASTQQARQRSVLKCVSSQRTWLLDGRVPSGAKHGDLPRSLRMPSRDLVPVYARQLDSAIHSRSKALGKLYTRRHHASLRKTQRLAVGSVCRRAISSLYMRVS
jgi:hypothetical protein